MGMKIFKYKWTKGKRNYYSVPGVKTAYALDLLIMKDIKLPNVNVLNISPRKAAKLLEADGWKWEKISDKEYYLVNGC